MDIQRVKRKKRKNVQEQNAVLRDNIIQCARWFQDSPDEFAWLIDILQKRGLSAKKGLLVNIHVIPEQEGDAWRGFWLTREQRFYEFYVMRSRNDDSVLEVEEWNDVTESFPATAHARGTGKSWTFLALELMKEGIES